MADYAVNQPLMGKLSMSLTLRQHARLALLLPVVLCVLAPSLGHAAERQQQPNSTHFRIGLSRARCVAGCRARSSLNTQIPPVQKPDPAKNAEEHAEEQVPVPSKAQAEDFAEQPSDVLLTYTTTVRPSDASRCVGLDSSGNAFAFGGVDQPTPTAIRLELVPQGAMPSAVRCPSATEGEVLQVAPASASPGGVVGDPIDPKYLTELPFGTRSYWIQPWRAYLDTWPASRLLNSVGINFAHVRANESEGTAELLQNSGFKLARIELSWNQLSYADPAKFANEHSTREQLIALREHGLRPLILLNANSGQPTPTKEVTLTTVTDAPAGSQSVRLSDTSAAEAVPGKTGFSSLSFGGNPDILITSVNAEGVAALSRPLTADLAAGPHRGATLLYAPFGPPQRSDGTPNPAFQETLTGWLSYVQTVCDEAKNIFGPGGYDLEVWNELSFGSQFLNQAQYYSPPRETGSGSVTQALLEATVAYVRDPEHGISPEVGVTDGFASQTPFAAGGLVPAGTTALSKHLYKDPQWFPDFNILYESIKPLDALGEPDVGSSQPPFKPLFTPEYMSALPEYFLTATQTETLVRDLAPIDTTISRVPHGRNIGLPGGVPPQTWMTEYNQKAPMLVPVDSEQRTKNLHPFLSPEEAERVEAEIVLRSLVAMVSKGVSREYFFAAARAGDYSLINESFMEALDADPSTYPGDERGGDTMAALHRMLAVFEGPGPNGSPRPLELLSIAQEGNHAEFTGDGSAAHPDLFDREVLAVFPFQSSPTRYVIPVYVMTSNLTTVYNSSPSGDSSRSFDLPDENFRITLGNLPASASPPTVSAYDPMRNEPTPARFVSRAGNTAVFELAATNYPRMLTIDFSNN